MLRSLYVLLISLVMAGIVHILIVLLVPSYAERDAWGTLAENGEPWSFSIVSSPDAPNEGLLPLVDPSFGVAACRFDLSQAPLVVETAGDVPYWSVALFDRQGQNIYSFNDRTAIGRRLFMIVVDPVQMARLRKSPPAESENAVLVEADIKDGFVLIRALQQDQSRNLETRAFLEKARCGRYVLPDQRNKG